MCSSDLFLFAITLVWHKKGYWVTTNNRSFALFCIAKCKHFRIRIASGFTADQQKRFDETPPIVNIDFDTSDHQSHDWMKLFKSEKRPPCDTLILCKPNNQAQLCVSNQSLSKKQTRGSRVLTTKKTSKKSRKHLRSINERYPTPVDNNASLQAS